VTIGQFSFPFEVELHYLANTAEPTKPRPETLEATLVFPLLWGRYQCIRPSRDYAQAANRSYSPRGCHNTLFMPALHNFATVVCKSYALLKTERRLLLHYEQSRRLGMTECVQPHKHDKVMPRASYRNRDHLFTATSWVDASSLEGKQLCFYSALRADVRTKLDQNDTCFPTLLFLLKQEMKLTIVTLASSTHIWDCSASELEFYPFFKSCAFIIKISSQLAHTYQTTATNLMLFSLKRRENFRKPKDADFRRDLIWDTSEFQDHPGLTCRLVALGYGSAAARVWPQVVKKWSSQRQQSLLTVFCLHRAHSIQKKCGWWAKSWAFCPHFIFVLSFLLERWTM